MPATVAHGLFEKTSTLYAGLEGQVRGGGRRPPLPPQDRQRAGTAGMIFGSYDGEIRYGVLSLNRWGLRTYGKVHCRLRAETIAHRVTFLETNSYLFVRRQELNPGDPIPAGYRAIWANRHLLALAKVEPHLEKDGDPAQWPDLLVRSDGRDRSQDEFIEAHIFGTFNSESIGSVEIDEEGPSNELEKLLARIVVARHRESQDSPIEGSTS